MLASKDAVARVFPDGDHATARTVLVCPVGIVVVCANFNLCKGSDSAEVFS